MSHIEIIAGVGAGKTTLGRCLAGHGFTLVEEEFESNPFLESFHKDPFSCAFEFGMTMLMMHYNRINHHAPITDHPVFDFSLVMNEGYARTYVDYGLIRPELGEAYVRLAQTARQQAVKPALRVYLDIAPEEQLRRILKRGRPLEKETPLDFLHKLKNHLGQVISSLDDGVRLMTLDAGAYNLADSAHDKQIVGNMVVQALESTHRQIKREFCQKGGTTPQTVLLKRALPDCGPDR